MVAYHINGTTADSAEMNINQSRADELAAQGYFDMVLQRSGGQLKMTRKGNIDVKVNVDLPSEKKPKKQGNKFYF